MQTHLLQGDWVYFWRDLKCVWIHIMMLLWVWKWSCGTGSSKELITPMQRAGSVI